MGIQVTSKGLLLDGNLTPLISGTLHYWRLDVENWGPLLDLVKGMGFDVVETYIPWSVHELDKGNFDFGDHRKNRDLDRFLKLVKERGLWVSVRPGPHINAEITYFGYPRRVLADPACQSRSVDGDPVWLPVPPKMFPAPSYAAEAFYKEVAGWYDAVCPIIRENLYPKGPVITIQTDNEFSNMFRTSAYDHDYHPDAIKLYHEFLEEKYKSIDALNKAYRSRYSKFDEVLPAREFAARDRDDLPYYLDWVEYREYYMFNALRRLKRMFEERGIVGIPVTHNYPCGYDMPPNNYTLIESELDFHGPDMYPQRRQYLELKSLVQFAAGLSRYPCIPEFSSGGFLWSLPLGLEDQRFTTPATFMHGIKGINFYMIVDRERWYGAPVSRDGRRRPGYYEFYSQFNRILKSYRIPELEKQTEVLLLSNRDYERLQIASTILDPLPPIMPDMLPPEAHCSEECLGFAQPIQMDAWIMDQAFFFGLNAAKITFNRGNTSQPLSALKKYKVILVSTFEFLAREVQEKLKAYAESGGFLVLGPHLPDFDENMQACTILKDACKEPRLIAGKMPVVGHHCGSGTVVWIQTVLPQADKKTRPGQTTILLRSLADQAGVSFTYTCEDPAIDTVLHQDSQTRILFIANTMDDDRSAEIKLGARETLLDVQSGEEFSGDGTASVPVPGFTVRIMEVRT